MPKLRNRLLVAAGAVLLLVPPLYVALSQPSEPSYGERTLSQWLVECVRAQPPGVTPHGERDPASVALDRIGTQAVPFLLKWLQYEEPFYRRVVDRFAMRVGTRIAWKQTQEAVLQSAARCGFEHLGTRARAAIPELVRLMNLPDAPETAVAASDALMFVGTSDALPPLLGPLTNRQHLAHRSAVFAVRRLGTNAVPAVPALVRCLQETNGDVARLAAASLAALQAQPDLVVPALAAHLRDANPRMRKSAALALGRYGPDAKASAPALVDALTNADLDLARVISNTLFQVAPQTLSNTPGR
jgi:hypothetical protein